MKILQQHEQFEMIVLDEMRKLKVLDQIIFGGGTMLRLCFELPRYSVDLDFYLKKNKSEFKPWVKKINECFEKMGAQITDHQEKFYSFLWEIKLNPYPRKLKIEIRKEVGQSVLTQLNIAHSAFSPLQVRLRTLTLKQMWINKINAIKNRNEIRDAYDLEFLTRRRAGEFAELDKATLKIIYDRLESYTNQDYKVKLGSLLNPQEREFILSNRYAYLKSQILALS